MSETPVRLEKPGQGLPAIEAFVARWILFPVSTQLTSDKKAIQTLLNCGNQVLKLAKELSEAQLSKKILIDRFTGIEDSSRFWSVLMTVSHLYITGEAMAALTEGLAQGATLEQIVRIEDVKPPDDQTPESVLSTYEKFLETYDQRMGSLLNNNLKSETHYHPWFGEITAHQWLCLNGMHHQIHLKQIQKIISNF